MIGTSLQAAIEFQREASRTDFRGELAQIHLPTVVIQGDADASRRSPSGR